MPPPVLLPDLDAEAAVIRAAGVAATAALWRTDSCPTALGACSTCSITTVPMAPCTPLLCEKAGSRGSAPFVRRSPASLRPAPRAYLQTAASALVVSEICPSRDAWAWVQVLWRGLCGCGDDAEGVA